MSKKFDGDIVSLDLLESLTKGLDFTIPDVDLGDDSFSIPEEVAKALAKTPSKVTLEELTSRRVNGSGVFDGIMEAIKKHLLEEYENGRITGAEYTKVYGSLVATALQSAVTFLLQKDKAYWDALQTQIGAITSNVNLSTAKVQLAIAKAQAHQSKAQYALTVLKLGTEDAQYAMVKENYESTRAQTLDARSDGESVTGSIGKQKALYDQQITSYQRDAEVKAAKIFSDAWITQKTIDEGLTAPTALQNASVDRILTVIKNNNNLA
jgi:hypothetical protein